MKEDKRVKELMSQILDYQLALENYEDLRGEDLDYLIPTHKRLGELRQNRKIWDDEKKIKEATKILQVFQDTVEKLGKENFTFYEGGSVAYTGPFLTSRRRKEEK